MSFNGTVRPNGVALEANGDILVTDSAVAGAGTQLTQPLGIAVVLPEPRSWLLQGACLACLALLLLRPLVPRSASRGLPVC